MVPEKQFERIIKHLRINGFGEKDIIVKFIHGEAAARVSPTDPFVVSVGSTFVYAKIHSPNEFARIDLLNKATKCMCNIIEKFAGSK